MNDKAANTTTKAAIRQRIWDHMERNDLANYPRPVHHRIPNFKGANAAGEKVVSTLNNNARKPYNLGG